jgi:hypothetical protein
VHLLGLAIKYLKFLLQADNLFPHYKQFFLTILENFNYFFGAEFTRQLWLSSTFGDNASLSASTARHFHAVENQIYVLQNTIYTQNLGEPERLLQPIREDFIKGSLCCLENG